MKFILSDCDVTIKVNGVGYDFEHVNEVAIDDPHKNRLTRGANAKNKTGIVFTEGLSQPKTITCTIMNMPAALKEVLDGCFNDQTRLDFYAIAADGSSKFAKEAILCNLPQQLNLTDSPDSLNVMLEIQSFDANEVHKS